MKNSKWFLASLVIFAMLFYAGIASATIVIDNADTVQADWVVSGTGVSIQTVDDGGGVYERRTIFTTPGAAHYVTSDYIAGDRTSYMDGSIEYDYRSLGIGSGDTWTATLAYPSIIGVRISGGADPSTQWIEFNINIYSDGLGWGADQDWHTIKLAFANGRGVLSGSEFDGAAATSSTLVGVYNNGLNSQALTDDLWANIASIDVIVYGPWADPAPDYAGAAFTNLELIPEPVTLGLLAVGSVLGIMHRRK